MQIIIYMAHNLVNDLRYIGQTRRLLTKRIYAHKWDALHNSHYKIHEAIRKFGFDSFEWIQLALCDSKEEANSLERQFIAEYSTFTKGYNSTVGGCGTRQWKHSALTKQKMSIAQSGSKNHAFGKSSCRKGCILSSTIRAKISASLGGKTFLVYDQDERLLGEWNNQALCAKELGLCQKHISSCLLGIRKTHRGLHFKHKDTF